MIYYNQLSINCNCHVVGDYIYQNNEGSII